MQCLQGFLSLCLMLEVKVQRAGFQEETMGVK